MTEHLTASKMILPDKEKSQKWYENNDKNNLQIGTYVYINYSKTAFNKSYDVQVC